MIRTRPSAKQTAFNQALSNLNQVQAERCRRSLFYFIKTFWHVVAPDEPVWNWHIPYLCETLEKIVERVNLGLPKDGDDIVNIPPGTTKSIIYSVMFPAWCWCKHPWLRFITASYTSALALEQAEKSRDILRSDKWKQLFPTLQLKQDKDVKSNFRIQTVTQDKEGNPKVELGGNRFSTSVGGSLTGFHGHILIIDDPLDPNRAASDVEIEKTNRWMEQTLSTRKISKANTPTLLIMQRLHENDPSGSALTKKDKKINHICLPADIRRYKERLFPKELEKFYINDLLDPVRMPWNVLEDMEADLGQYGYSGQMGQNPTPPGGGMFLVSHFTKIQTLPPLHEIVQSARYWDKAGSTDTGCFTVGVLMHKLKNGKFIVADVVRGQWAADEREAKIRSVAEADGYDTIIYHEQEPGSGGKESADATIRNLAGYMSFADRPTGEKSVRADPFSVQVNRGNVQLLQAEWNYEYIKEHRYFPYGTYKDQVDSSAGVFNKLASKKQAGSLL